MTEKRQLVTQLPAVNQTDTLKNFFSATIDHLFQPGSSEILTGYVGQKPVYYDSTKDFYITEPTAARTQYQLEPVMISQVSGNVAYTLFYDDLVNYLDSVGANTVDHSRLFSSEYYSWSPPINLDAINNPNQYIWMGGLSDSEYEQSLLNLKSPRNVYKGDGSQTVFTLPAAIFGFSVDDEVPRVLVDGVEVTASITNGQATILAPAPSATVEVIRYGDLSALMVGKGNVPIYPFQAWEHTSYGFNDSDQYVSSVRRYKVGEVVYIGNAYGVGNYYICETEHDAGATFTTDNWKLIDFINITSGLRLRLIDGVSADAVYIVDGVGTSISLTPDRTQEDNSSTPIYIVNDRRSLDKNPWSLKNLWIHRDTLKWSDLDMNYRKGIRPIIEFLPNIELYNYGVNRLDDVQAIITSDSVNLLDNWDMYPYDNNVWDLSTVDLANINGKFFGQINGQYVGSIITDDNYILQPNDRILVIQANATSEGLNQRIYRVIADANTTLLTGGNATVIELVSEGAPVLGDIVRVVPGNGAATTIPYSAFNNYSEYLFNGEEWIAAQAYEQGAPPLFVLYDSVNNKLDDPLAYPNSSFAGNRIFGYQIGTGVDDSVLGFPVVLNEYEKNIFEIDSITKTITYGENQSVFGYRYHHFLDNDTYSNNWFLNPQFSTQTKVADGIYSIPLNLQANPNNEEVTFISKNEWFDHFNSIMTSQSNFVGSAYSINNYRDTEKYFGYGDYVIQHRCPLLKTMLMIANDQFDLVTSINFVEHEYGYFRNKFIQTINTFYQTGVLMDTDTPENWVQKILEYLRLNKNSDSPFSLSRMGGGQYYIPPTPASLGVSPIVLPNIFYDTTLGNMKMVSGHDGSRVPAFGDFRDDILLAFEFLIYNNIDPLLKTERPVFDLAEFVYDQGEYSYKEHTDILEPYFYKWTNDNELDYRPNTDYDKNNLFTWNYSTAAGVDGVKLPGHWRGIYFKYFDTDRPHTRPWEMLGFTSKPLWWDIEYGVLPYTAGNTKMWDDIRDGRILYGERAGLHARYAKPLLYSTLPVSEEGDLLDPITAGIVTVAPLSADAAADWKYGDGSPVEYLWRTSPSYYFSNAIAGFLMKPSRFVEEGWDTISNQKASNGQYINVTTGNRPQNSSLYVHGEFKNKEKVYACGIQQFVSEFIISTGTDPVVFGDAVRGLNVRLGHKMAGYTSLDSMKATTDNFGLIPSDDITLVLHKSPSIKNDFYSGVIVEWNGRGWAVTGYDSNHPWFNVDPPMKTSDKTKMSLSTNTTSYNEWRPSTNYAVNTKITYNGVIYVAVKSHLSSAKFETQFWDVVGPLVLGQDVSVLMYAKGTGDVVKVPYGTVLYSFQEVADFLLGFERYMVGRGWVFDQIDNGEVIDWKVSVRDFLEWAQVEWEPGNFIALSPATYSVKYVTKQGQVSNVLGNINGKKGLIGKTGRSKTADVVAISRIDDTTIFQTKDGDIYGVRVNVEELEHAIIFSNLTIFGDVIYKPLFNLRQPRVRLIGNRSTDWTGRLDAPGYIIVNNQIVSNFAKQADDFIQMYDIENVYNTTFSNQVKHVIGYNSKDYLANLALNEIQQFEFYQGMIHQKGAVGSFDKLLRSDFIDQNRDLVFSEEWGFKIDSYGAITNREITALMLEQSKVTKDVEIVHLTVGNAVGGNFIEVVDTSVIDSRWVDRPSDPLNTFDLRPNYKVADTDMPVSGFVRLDEADHIVFGYNDVANLTNVLEGETVWVHSVDATRGISASETTWYFVGNAVGTSGVWDTGHLLLTANSAYIAENSNGDIVFRSKVGQAPFMTTSTGFVAEPGKTYRTEYRVRKISPDTTGIGSYLRPAFDVYDANGVLTSTNTQGIRYGEGYESGTDMINTTDWQIGKYYTIGATWVVPDSVISGTIIARVRVNRNLPDAAPFSNALYEFESQTVFEEDENMTWNIFKMFAMSATGNTNTIRSIETITEDPSLSTIRIYMQNPHGLTNNDIGRYIYIDRDTLTNPNFFGFHKVSDVSGDSFFDLLAIGSDGHDFTSDSTDSVPIVSILRPMRFKTISGATSSGYNFTDGDLVYIDGSDVAPWKVMRYAGTDGSYTQDDYSPTTGSPVTVISPSWSFVRTQPKRVDVKNFKSALVYDKKTKITNSEIYPEPLVISRLNLVSPLTGYINGSAKNDIDFISDIDPASYNTIGITTDTVDDTLFYGSVWGQEQVGFVWWDLSTCRFLEYETDNVAYGLTETSKYLAELEYRKNNIGTIAPACSVDVYEWVKSYDLPENYTGEGTVKYSYTQYVKSLEYSNGVGTPVYYFWVKNRTDTPMVHNRSLATYTIASLLASPVSQDSPWIAPIAKNAFVIGSVKQYLDDAFDNNSGTVIQLESGTDYDGAVHEEWILLKENDQKDEVVDWLWDGLRDSLVGYSENNKKLPEEVATPEINEQVNEAPVWQPQ